MAAGTGLSRVLETVGHDEGTETWELAQALGELGIKTSGRLKRVSRTKPVLPKRALVHIWRYGDDGRRAQAHWMLYWDGVMYDPSDRWPEGYANWRITSAMEIYE